MTEPITAPETATETQDDPPAAYTPPATQADLDRIIAERVSRTKNQFKDYAELKAAKAELDQIRAQNQTTEQRQAEELARWQSEAEKWRTASVASRIEAIAAPDFDYPADAVAKLNPADYLDSGGVINEQQIRADLAELLEERPNWRRQETAGQAPRLPAPNHAQGSGGKSPQNPAAEFGALVQGALRGS